jgi:hypothetical protein
MELVLRTHENYGDPVWGVIWMVAILLIIVSWYIYYILKGSFKEMNDGRNGAPEQEELLQLPSDGDQQSP